MFYVDDRLRNDCGDPGWTRTSGLGIRNSVSPFAPGHDRLHPAAWRFLKPIHALLAFASLRVRLLPDVPILVPKDATRSVSLPPLGRSIARYGNHRHRGWSPAIDILRNVPLEQNIAAHGRTQPGQYVTVRP